MLSSENHYPPNSQDTDNSKKPLGPRPYPLGKGSAKTPSENQNEMPANRPPTSPNSYYSHPYMGPRAQPSYPMYPPGHKAGYSPYMYRPQGYPPIYYSYGQPPPIISTTPSIASAQPTNGAPTGMAAGSTLPSGHAAARPTYPPPRTNFGVAYPPPRSYISQPTSPVTASSDASSPTQSTEISSEGGRSDKSAHESLPGKSDEEMEKELKASLQALSIPSHAEHPSSTYDEHSPYMHRGHSDSSLANHSNLMPSTTATSSNLELPSIRHPIQNRRYNHSDSSVNNHALARRDSINSIDSYTSDECDSLRGSTTNSDNFPLRPTSIIELRPKEFCPSKSNRNSNVPSLLNLSAPGDPLKRANHRASMTLVNEESALGMYRETAKKTNDPNTQLEFAKFLLFSSTAFGDPNTKDGNPSLKKLLDEAIYWIKKLQKAGQPEAMYIYATWLEKGMYEIPQSLEKAIAF
ncbi:hypothetical protein K7432_005899 [Basidiobolus ranarum]|uniref:Uncharacterized protein n=1 Tax=Basidiobolus ranarum TaxID=34480 RepID=A0ABR2WVQ9_9FUNG